MGITFLSSFFSCKPAKVYVYGCFVFSRFLSFQERSSLDKHKGSSPIRSSEGVKEVGKNYQRSRGGTSKLVNAIKNNGYNG
ncbi:hypothetical protein PIB30_078764 [Stylosanthes scabra]|uniref:Uncharacterized protein n=1 Tax=Stylosanthes scabra TaxID=79078 RepID=A0ABU6UQD7_9FABA|nr:hypothetical protein [Stylosanthes scabra]